MASVSDAEQYRAMRVWFHDRPFLEMVHLYSHDPDGGCAPTGRRHIFVRPTKLTFAEAKPE